MRLKLYVGLILALLFVCAAYSALAQTVPAAKEERIPFAIGADISGFNPDWGQGRIMSETVWIDYTPTRVPSFLRGIGLELEARDLNFGRTLTVPPLMVEESAGVG